MQYINKIAKKNTQNRDGKATIEDIRQQRDANLDARPRCSWQNKYPFPHNCYGPNNIQKWKYLQFAQIHIFLNQIDFLFEQQFFIS